MPNDVILSLLQSSMNVGVQVAEGEFILDADTDHIYPDVLTTTSEEIEGGADLKHTVVKRVFHLLQLLPVNEYTRAEIFERQAPYYKIDDIATDSDSSSRRADRMFERDIKLLEEQGFEIQKIKARKANTLQPGERLGTCCIISL